MKNDFTHVGLQNPDFTAAFFRLARKVSPEYELVLLQAMDVHLNELRVNPSREMPTGLLGPFVIALLHVTVGTPLYMSDELLVAWAQNQSGDVTECAADGYRMPASETLCPICSGETGQPGCFAARRGRVAALN
jgi:hypothetical protein